MRSVTLRGGSLSLLFFLLSTGLAGCLGDGSPVVEPGRFPAVEAVYQSPDWGRSVFALAAPEQIHDASGHIVWAYPLTLTIDTDPDEYVYWLDANLRPVVEEGRCAAWADDECLRRTVYWEREGLLDDLGLSLGLDLLLDRPLERNLFGLDVELSPSVTSESERAVATFDLGSFGGIDGAPFTGRFEFARNEFFPTRVQTVWTTSDWTIDLTRVSYEVVAPPPSIAVPAAGAGGSPYTESEETVLMFAGEADDTFSLGWSHRDLLDVFLRDFSEAQAWLESGGCLTYYSVQPARESEPRPLLDLSSKRAIGRVTFSVLASDGSGAQWKSDAVEEDGKIVWTDVEREDVRKSWSCAAAASPAPTLPLDEFLSRSHSLIQSHDGFLTFGFMVKPVPGHVRSAENGWHSYEAYYRPKHSDVGDSFLPHLLRLHADTGRFQIAVVHSSDVDGLV